jgi:hypothetical protein
VGKVVDVHNTNEVNIYSLLSFTVSTIGISVPSLILISSLPYQVTPSIENEHLELIDSETLAQKQIICAIIIGSKGTWGKKYILWQHVNPN